MATEEICSECGQPINQQELAEREAGICGKCLGLRQLNQYRHFYEAAGIKVGKVGVLKRQRVVYSGMPERTAKGGFKVFRNGKLLLPERSQKLVNHSPDGFNWGYGGSGPAQLALALLLDVTKDKELSLSLHQQFKWDYIARLIQGAGWIITDQDVRNWLKRNASSNPDVPNPSEEEPQF